MGRVAHPAGSLYNSDQSTLQPYDSISEPTTCPDTYHGTELPHEYPAESFDAGFPSEQEMEYYTEGYFTATPTPIHQLSEL